MIELENLKKAVDVVLLPREDGMGKAIELNKKLVEKRIGGAEIVLDKKTCLPHVSLAMGCIRKSDLPEIEQVLKTIAQKNPIGNLRINGIVTSQNSRGESVSSFEIEKTERLQQLHEEIMNAMDRFFRFEVTEQMLYGDEKIAGSTLDWIKNYRKNSSFEKFFPHITLGYGIIKELGTSFYTEIASLAVCHLGNHCTCRKILAEIKI